MHTDPPDPRHLPLDNTPGHHPEVEQDKPTRHPHPPSVRFPFAANGVARTLNRLVGIDLDEAAVRLQPFGVTVRYGPWSMDVAWSDIESCEVTGPYLPPKVLGPPHVSLVDRGITFGTNARRGVCVRFTTPQPGIEPLGVLKHPGMTVTVEEPDRFARLVSERIDETRALASAAATTSG